MAKKRSAKKVDTEKPEAVALPIQWSVPDNVETHYANHMVVAETPHEYVLYFFTLVPPLIWPPEAAKQMLEELKAVRAHCVTRVIVPREQYPAFVKALQSRLKEPISVGEDNK